MKLKLIKKEKVAKNTMMFWFEPDSPVHQIAGQYIELFVPHDPSDDRKAKRWFTLSNSPTEKFLAITTKIHPKRPSSYKNALDSFPMGSEFSALPPMGDFVLPKDETLPLVFIAGGIGITPYRSILKYLQDTDEKRNIKLIYTVSNPDEFAFSDLIESKRVKLIKHVGRLDSVKILEYIGNTDGKQIYISGPEKMVETLQKELLDSGSGISELQLRVDFFHNYD